MAGGGRCSSVNSPKFAEESWEGEEGRHNERVTLVKGQIFESEDAVA